MGHTGHTDTRITLANLTTIPTHKRTRAHETRATACRDEPGPGADTEPAEPTEPRAGPRPICSIIFGRLLVIMVGHAGLGEGASMFTQSSFPLYTARCAVAPSRVSPVPPGRARELSVPAGTCIGPII